MEQGHLAHDLPPSEPSRLELQRQIDELFLEHDREVARILSEEVERLRHETT